MATTLATARSGNLKTVLPVIAKDFEAIKIGFTKLVKLKKEESITRSSEVSRQRQASYKEKFSKVTLNKIDPRKKTLAEHTRGFFSVLKSIAGVLGSVFLVLGAAGIGKMIMSSDAGKFLGKFLATVFTALVDLVKASVTLVQSLFKDVDVKTAFFTTISSVFQFIGEALMVGFGMFKALLSDGEIITTIVNTIKNVFSAIFESLSSLTSIAYGIFKENEGDIKDGIVNFFTKIIDVLVPTLSIVAGSFSALVSDERFTNAIKSIGTNLIQLLVDAWKVEYTAKDGAKKSIAGNIIQIIAEAAILYAAMLKFKIEMIKLGAAIGSANFSKPGVCDCGPVTPSDLPEAEKPDKRRRPGSYQEKMGDMGDKKASRRFPKTPTPVEEVAKPKSLTQRVTGYVSEKAANITSKLKSGFESLKGRAKQIAESLYKPVVAMAKSDKLKKMVFEQFGKRFGQAAVAKLGAFFAAQGAALAAAPITGGVSLLIGALGAVAFAYDLYCLYDLLFVSSDGEKEDGGYYPIIKAEIEKFWQEQTAPKRTETPSQPSNVPPLPDSKASTNIAETKTPTPTPGMAPAPTAPSPVAQSAGIEEMKGKVIGAGTAAAAAEATAALQANMKKGDVSAKQHEPGTDVLAQKLPGLIPGFNRFTAFDDAFHNKVSPGSKHASGLALDFTVNGGSAEYAKAAEAVRKHLASVGLNSGDVKVIDEMNNPSSKATGPHIHIQFQSKEAADKYRGLFPDMPLTAFAKDAAPKEGTPFTLPTPSATLAGVDQQKEEKQKSLASLMMDDLTGSLAMMDQITGGKLGLASNDMKSMLRGLEDEMNRGTNFFNNSINIATQNIKNDSGAPSTIQQTNQNILNTILNRQYA